jgi:hypothetical protein
MNDMSRKPLNVNWRPLALTMLLVAVSVTNAPSQAQRSITVAWDRNIEPVGGYVVHVGIQSHKYTETYDVGDRTNFTYRKAVQGRRYYFAVSAYTLSRLEGQLSEEVLSDDGSSKPVPPRTGRSGRAPTDREDGRRPAWQSFPVTGKRGESCADTEDCYTIRTRATGLQSVSALNATPDGRLFVVENEQQVRLLADDGVLPAPALNAVPDGLITEVIVDPAFETTGRVFIGVMHPTRLGDSEFSVLRSRLLQGRLTEAAVVIAGLPASSGGRPRIAIDSAARVYIAMPAAGATRRDLYAGTILRLNDDGTVVAGSRAASPVLAYGFETPAGLSADGRDLWTAGFDPRWPQAVARLSLDSSATDDWPRVMDPVAIASSDASGPAHRVVAAAVSRRVAGSDEGQLLAYIDAAHKLFVIHLSSGTVQRRDDLSDAIDGFVPEALAIGPARRIYIAARAGDGSSSVLELAPPIR